MRTIQTFDLSGRLVKRVLANVCDMAQGFYFAKPLPPEAASEFLTE